MNFKPELLAKVLNQEKTQTRRPVKDGDEIEHFILPDYNTGERSIWIVRRNGRVHYKAGNIYSVCPGRGKSGQGEVRLMRIRQEDVRNISIEDVIAEGFGYNMIGFWQTWCGFYDPKAFNVDMGERRKNETEVDWAKRMLMTRPANLYLAWSLTFELVK